LNGGRWHGEMRADQGSRPARSDDLAPSDDQKANMKPAMLKCRSCRIALPGQRRPSDE
jgi:hypothetical protein